MPCFLACLILFAQAVTKTVIPMALLRLESGVGLDCDHRMVEASVRTLHETVQRLVAHLEPLLHNAAEAGQARKFDVVVRKRGSRNLVP